MSPVDPLEADALRAALGDLLIGNKIVVLKDVTSTNDMVAQMASENEEGLVVIAEQQKAGRGQYGRRWESAAGKGLWLSVLLRPKIALADSGRIIDLLATSIVATLTEVGLAAAIKPPNDVYVAGRKVAGVLVEMRVESGGSYCAIAGLGLNINHALEDFPPELRETAGSLAMIAGHAINRFNLTVALLKNLNTRYPI
jgi:BirA family biotin operon repressor/biotin-[acetyl-CoA-carboxylase] ligase